MFLDVFRYFWLIFIDLLKDSMFFPCFWVCLINHFFIVSFNVFQCVSLFFMDFHCLLQYVHCFSMFFQCSWMYNPSKWVQNLNEPQSTLEHSSKQPDTGLNFHSMAQRMFRFLVKFTQIGLTCFFLSFSVKPLNSFKNNSKADLCTNSDLQSATTSMETRNSLTWTSNEPQMGLNSRSTGEWFLH